MDSPGSLTWPTPKKRHIYLKHFLYLPKKPFFQMKNFCTCLEEPLAHSPGPSKRKRNSYPKMSYTYPKNNFSKEKFSYTHLKEPITGFTHLIYPKKKFLPKMFLYLSKKNFKTKKFSHLFERTEEISNFYNYQEKQFSK